MADNGPGIPPELREKIFDPFFSTKGSKGTGLGLATSAKVVEEHGGRLELAPTASGACFRIIIPGVSGGETAEWQEF